MHKKTIHGTVYYYTSVRENGKVKTIYLGRDEKEALKKEKKIRRSRKKYKNKLFTIIVLILLATIVGSRFTGFFLLDEETYVFSVNITAENDVNYTWTPETNATITSVMISGFVKGNGSAKVFLISDDKYFLIFDTSNIPRENKTNETVVFLNVCNETCRLDNLNESNYTLAIYTDNGTILHLENITYTVKRQESLNLTAPENVSNQTQNLTLENVTFENITINETDSIQGNLSNQTLNISIINKTINETQNLTVFEKPANISQNLTQNITTNVTFNESLPIIQNITENLTTNLTSLRNITVENISSTVENLKRRFGLRVIKFIERVDKKHELTFSIGNASIALYGVNISEIKDVRLRKIKRARIGNEEISLRTDTIILNNLSVERATIILKKYGPVNVILKCDDFDFENDLCKSWKITDIPFTDNGTHVIFTITGFSGYSAGWWNETWNYSREIIIEEESGTDLYEYQVRVVLNTQQLILEGKMRSDCGDIRFVNESNDEIPYYLEEGECNKTDTTIWVKVPYIQSGMNTSIYVYYGNEYATSHSNLTQTFSYTQPR
ncbi:MAG: hypothetical protein DRP15_02695, partial [Candidatus Aenigmatarchaeota archaeon]